MDRSTPGSDAPAGPSARNVADSLGIPEDVSAQPPASPTSSVVSAQPEVAVIPDEVVQAAAVVVTNATVAQVVSETEDTEKMYLSGSEVDAGVGKEQDSVQSAPKPDMKSSDTNASDADSSAASSSEKIQSAEEMPAARPTRRRRGIRLK
jgi:hypothetical protein